VAATLRLGVTADALSTDPIASSDNPSIWTQLLLYDQLVRPSRDGTRLEPGVAESWRVSPTARSTSSSCAPTRSSRTASR
jgi:peptide/nickel transport system substrate-binding protein